MSDTSQPKAIHTAWKITENEAPLPEIVDPPAPLSGPLSGVCFQSYSLR